MMDSLQEGSMAEGLRPVAWWNNNEPYPRSQW